MKVPLAFRSACCWNIRMAFGCTGFDPAPPLPAGWEKPVRARIQAAATSVVIPTHIAGGILVLHPQPAVHQGPGSGSGATREPVGRSGGPVCARCRVRHGDPGGSHAAPPTPFTATARPLSVRATGASGVQIDVCPPTQAGPVRDASRPACWPAGCGYWPCCTRATIPSPRWQFAHWRLANDRICWAAPFAPCTKGSCSGCTANEVPLPIKPLKVGSKCCGGVLPGHSWSACRPRNSAAPTGQRNGEFQTVRTQCRIGRGSDAADRSHRSG